VIDPKSGTFKVTVGVRSDKPAELPPGLFVGVRIVTDTRPAAILVPKRAMVYEGGERFIYAVVNGKAVKRKLTAGYEDPDTVEALSGVDVGMAVIVLGQSGLRDGALVRSVNALPAAELAKTPGGEAKAEAKKAPAKAPGPTPTPKT
jgi:membrane fusion protein (multidrug efflux system)